MDKNALYTMISHEICRFERLVRDHEAARVRAHSATGARFGEQTRRHVALYEEVKASRRKLKELIADIS